MLPLLRGLQGSVSSPAQLGQPLGAHHSKDTRTDLVTSSATHDLSPPTFSPPRPAPGHPEPTVAEEMVQRRWKDGSAYSCIMVLRDHTVFQTPCPFSCCF